eukprot:4296777-Prymnesium_polylepis.2
MAMSRAAANCSSLRLQRRLLAAASTGVSSSILVCRRWVRSLRLGHKCGDPTTTFSRSLDDRNVKSQESSSQVRPFSYYY